MKERRFIRIWSALIHYAGAALRLLLKPVLGPAAKVKYFLSKESLFWYCLYWMLFGGMLIRIWVGSRRIPGSRRT